MKNLLLLGGLVLGILLLLVYSAAAVSSQYSRYEETVDLANREK